ncbi:hypothetical protein VE01_08500 [Pseudogymnoascus verrucosus]|uniref:Uncharacterized protein n=1 Tax=Pseudogymnoascus verrucosus TaxID=342668 RepID=A0A1B8GD95_9PEZI|nr:uncharacterized protein VE01_08500 [Pseudogymnoascus verrucosus]OBT93825.1 hypothetical protein VE01_08500 [Pseudogymnoascus verrucosus]
MAEVEFLLQCQFWAKLKAEKEVAPKDEDLDFVLSNNPLEALAKGEAPIFKAYLC